jgi:hypothetical protein
MSPTNQLFRTRLQRIDARLRQLERYGRERIRAGALEQLREERDMLNLVLLNRRVESAKRVVDLQRWRSANGVVALVLEEAVRSPARTA